MRSFITSIALGGLLSMATFAAPAGIGSDPEDDDDLDIFGFGDDDGFDTDDFDDALALAVGLDAAGAVQGVSARCKKGKLTAKLFETDAWRDCQAKTGMTPTEYLAAAFAEAKASGNDDLVEAIVEQGLEDQIVAAETGVSDEDYGAQFDKGTAEGEAGVALR